MTLAFLAQAFAQPAAAAPSDAITLENAISVYDLQIDPADAAAEATIANDRSVTGQGSVASYSGTWLTPADATPGDYEVEFHLETGTAWSGAAADTWLALSSSRTITVERDTVGQNGTVVRIRIRRASDQVVLKTVTWYFTAEVGSS